MTARWINAGLHHASQSILLLSMQLQLSACEIGEMGNSALRGENHHAFRATKSLPEVKTRSVFLAVRPQVSKKYWRMVFRGDERVISNARMKSVFICFCRRRGVIRHLKIR
jgi:hypothetical protein